MVTTSYVIGHRGTSPERVKNLFSIIKWIRELNYDVLVLEQDSKPIFEEEIISAGARYIFLKNDGLYNRSWAFNVAYHHSDTEVLAFADNDMILYHGVLSQAQTLCKNYGLVQPYSFCIDLSSEQTDIFYNSQRLNRSNDIRLINFGGGVAFMRRDIFESLGGWDENFEGWGGEDDAMVLNMVKSGFTFRQLSNPVFHLYHPRSQNDGTNQHEKYKNNLELLDSYRQGKQVLVPLSSKGNLNKYEKF